MRREGERREPAVLNEHTSPSAVTVETNPDQAVDSHITIGPTASIGPAPQTETAHEPEITDVIAEPVVQFSEADLDNRSIDVDDLSGLEDRIGNLTETTT